MERSDSPPAIIIDKLSKRYGNAKKYALKDLSLHVDPGEVYGFLGPNGAGKSTTIRLLLNFLQPTSGTATILGRDIQHQSVAIRQDVGYLAGDFALYPKMTGLQLLDYLASLQGSKNVRYTIDLAKRFKADLKVPLGNLSKGNRQKVGIIQAFMHQPKILILDEPTGGLDPLMQEEFYALVRECKARGASIFVSSHNLSEVQIMCDRVGIIKDGELVSEQTIKDLAREAAQTFTIVFSGKPPVPELGKVKGVKHIAVNDNIVTLHQHGDINPLIRFLAQQDITKLASHELNLEEEFLRYYEKESA